MKLKKPSKRIVIFSVLALLLVLGAGIYTWQSLSVWKAYEARLTSQQKEYGQLKDQALSGDSSQKRLEALRKLDDKLNGRAKLCDINGLFAWQASVVPTLKEGVGKCKTAQKQLDTLAKPLSALREYLDVADKIRSTVGNLALNETLTEKNWTEKGLAKAKQVKSDLSKLSASGDAVKLKTQAVTLSDSLISAWEALIKANEAKDKAAYLAASAGVVKAYADFSSLADGADEMIKQKAQTLTDAAGQLKSI